MYGGSDDGSSCDSPGESLSELDLSEDGPVFSPDGSPIIVPRTPPPRRSNSTSSCRLLTQVAGLLNLFEPWSSEVSPLD